MKYDKSIGGGWLTADELKNDDKVKLVTESKLQDSKYTYPDGNFKKENIAKARLKGAEESKNMRLNWATINGLIDAYGPESKEWIGKVLTVKLLEAMVGDKMRTIVYLIPDGFELAKNEESKMEIRKIGGATVGLNSDVEDMVNSPDPTTEDEEINPNDIPF